MTDLPPIASGPVAVPRVLLVEDNEAASKGLAKLLEVYGFEVTTAFDGGTALKALTTGRPPDFLLTDMQLPDMDGREVALQARELDPRPRVVLITGWDFESSEEARSAWGIDWVLTKPIDIQDLLAKLRMKNAPEP